MNIAWYCDHPDFVALGKASVASARRHMPGARCVQLGTPGCARIEGVDDLITYNVPGNILGRRMMLQSPLPGDWLFVDVDIEFRADVSDVFDRDFDVAIPWVDDPNVRYTGGIVFSRFQVFHAAFAMHPACRDPNATMKMMTDTIFDVASQLTKAGIMRPVLELSPLEYERVPRNAQDPCDGAKVVHYRGPRKRWMAL